MISRANRFHGHGSLRYVYTRGEIVRGQLFSLKYAPNKRRKTYRAAVVVSRKVHKSAVVRNRIRRRMYEVIRQSVAQGAAFDIVFVVYSDRVANLAATEVNDTIRQQLQKAGIITGDQPTP